jgi:hypothetical protein
MKESNQDQVKIIGQLINLPISLSILGLELALAAMRNMQQFLAEASGDGPVAPVPATAQSAMGGTPSLSFRANGTMPQPDLVHDTLNGLAAFVVPGPDRYSAAQGMSANEPGAVDTHVTDVLITVLDRAVPSPPKGPPSSAAVAMLLNQVAQRINPSASGTSPSLFSRLSFKEKVGVFQFIEGDPSMVPFRRIGGLLAFFVAFIFYSEASTFDFATHALKGRPIGWTASDYQGVSDGQCEFKGYYQNRRQAEKDMGV